MYKITITQTTPPLFSEKLVYNYLHPNGCYVEFNRSKPNQHQPEQPEGICVRVPCVVENEDGEQVTVIQDKVFALYEGALNGTEEVCTIEEVDINNILVQLQTAFNQ